MNPLTRLAHGGLNGWSRCRRSMHLVPGSGRGPREISPVAKDPSWVLLDSRVGRQNNSFVANAKTTAETRTSTGKRLRVAFDLVAPPASSFLYYDTTETVREDKFDGFNVIAAHGESVLLRMPLGPSPRGNRPYDHFLYTAGQPPYLSLLPPLKVLKKYEEGSGNPNCRPLLHEDTGILRKDDGKILVARIEVLSEHSGGKGMANLCILRPGTREWEEKRLVPIVHEEGEEVMGSLSGPDIAISVVDRFLCWFGSHSGFILCDMSDEGSPKLRHVPLPGVPYDPEYYANDLLPLTDSRNMGAASDNSIKFVTIEPRCCCGRFGRSSCSQSRHAFTVTTWMLVLTMDGPITWVKDAMLDCEDIWALPGYEGIQRVPLQCPVVSLDNPDVVCFRVIRNMANREAWMIQVDTRRKALLGAVQCTADPGRSFHSSYLRQAKLY